MTMTVHTYRPRQFHRTSNGENPSSGYRDMGSASLAAARPAARLPARTVTTIPLKPGGLRGKKYGLPTVHSHKLLRFWSRYLEISFITPRYFLEHNLSLTTRYLFESQRSNDLLNVIHHNTVECRLTRSILSWYYTWYCNDSSTTWIRL